MSCTSWQDLLDETPLSAIDRARQADLEVHAAGCRTCAQRLATERLLSGAWAGERRLQPSRSLQAALLAVPRQEKRGRFLSLWAVPVSALAIGLLAWLAPDVLQRQRAQIDLPAAPAAGEPVAAPATAAAVAGQVAPTASPMVADRPARAPAFGSGREPAPQAVAGSTAPPGAAATPPPAVPGLGSAGRGDAPRTDRSPHATPTAADMGASKAATGPGPTEPDPGSTSDPGGDEPIGTAAPEVTPGGGAGLRPGPGETATPEQGPSERPVPPGVTSTPRDRGATVVPSTPTTAAGTAAPGIQPSPSETPTPTAAVTETVTPTPTPTAP